MTCTYNRRAMEYARKLSRVYCGYEQQARVKTTENSILDPSNLVFVNFHHIPSTYVGVRIANFINIVCALDPTTTTKNTGFMISKLFGSYVSTNLITLSISGVQSYLRFTDVQS